MTHYEWLRAAHLLSMIAWMAGLLYLPRLMIYQLEAGLDTPTAQTLSVMQQRLLKRIMLPAMLATWLFGLGLLFLRFELISIPLWMWAKLLFVLGLSAYHGYFSNLQKNLAAGHAQITSKKLRLFNEVPALLAIVIVLLVILEPFG